jgi:hypothetical protein
MNEWSFDGTLGQKNDPHSQVDASYFTCHPVTPNATSFVTEPSRFYSKPTGRSLDHVCAEQVNPSSSPPLLMQIGGIDSTGSGYERSISWEHPQTVFPGLGTPMAVYTSLTGLFGSGATSPDTYQAASGKSVIDLVRSDLQSLQRVNMSASDKKKLSDWADLLNQTTGAALRQCNADTAANLGVSSDTVKPVSGADLSTISPLMLDLAVLAAMCDLSRVIFVKFPVTYVFKFLGLTLDSHSVSHRIGNAGMGGTCVDNALDMIATIDSWYAQQFAYFVGRLDSVKEGDQTLLDNTATVWFQEMSDGNSHNLNNLPILQAGGCGGYFKTGWAVNVEGGKPDLTAGHSDEDCKDGKSPINTLDVWGTPPDQATQPINKYHCNLMNAIGVKAGPDGFATKGGTQEVTCYGKYDDTKFFGTDEPAHISNPGEYNELRANR